MSTTILKPVPLGLYRDIISKLHHPCGLPHDFGEGCFEEWFNAVAEAGTRFDENAARLYAENMRLREVLQNLVLACPTWMKHPDASKAMSEALAALKEPTHA